MDLPVRSYRCYPLDRENYDESGFGYVAHDLALDPEHTALVTVDLWNVGWPETPLIPELGRYAEINFLGVGARAAAEARRRTEENLAPALEAARDAGLIIIHSNTEAVVRKHPECLYEVETASGAEATAGWPPGDVGWAARGDYFRHTFGPDAEDMWTRLREVLDFPEAVRPVAGDYCVYQQAAVDALLAQHQVTTVLFSGFLLGHCLQDRVGGLRSLGFLWRWPGYRAVLLRDCTLAQEYHHTIQGFRATETFVTWLEATGVPSATAADLIAGCTHEE